jgi:putative ubiquitin-RnfH superfamily antitoxin RatB of RatAB toxin-antitoxin module
LAQRHPAVDFASLRVGVWGKLRELGDALRDLDRVEIYRPLKVDPKEARRVRYRQHRERYAPK